ncbi:response regulator transcription factor [Gracilibacillus timonensis]|uniref:response regulator transcription factor n=1 Tax=Gracilibacillus timonensis TaxID=1816696 RepID=UPI000825DD16|nr:response regulator [Gracilibacillus timonensis]
MYRIMLIDDDVPMLRYLEKLIKETDIEVEVCASEYSSVKAFDRFKQKLPDIVLSDIGLPQVDGLALSEKLKKIKPDVRIIFLTCHESFDYARKAMELNVDDYLLKDELDKAQLTASIKKSQQHIQQSQSQHDLISFKETLHKHKYVLRQNFLEQLLDSNPIEQTIQDGLKLGIKWEFPHFYIGRVLLHYAEIAAYYDKQDIPLIKYGMYNIAEEIAKDFQGVTPLMDNDRNIYLFLNFRYSLSSNHLQQLQDYVMTLAEKVKEILRISVFAIYHPKRLNKEEIRNGALALRNDDNYSFYTNDKMEALMTEEWSVDSRRLLKSLEMQMLQALQMLDISKFQQLLGELDHLSTEHKVDPSLVKELGEHCLASMEVNQHKAGKLADFKFYITTALRIKDVLNLLEASAVYYEQNKRQVSTGQLQLQEIDRYITQYLSSNITSADMAGYLYLNPSYFSRYFKKLAGENFTEYIQKYKIGIAKNMLLEGKTIEAVASELGFSDRTYFSKIFKKHTGYSPGEFKAKEVFV